MYLKKDSLGRAEIMGDGNVVDLAPGFRTTRQSMSAQRLQSTKTAPYLRPQKTHVGHHTDMGRVRTGRNYNIMDDMTGCHTDMGRVRTGRNYNIMDDMTGVGDDNVIDLAPGFRTTRQSMSAQRLQSTKSAPYLRPQKTHVGDNNVIDLAPGFRTTRQSMSAQRLQATKSAPYLRPQKTHVGAGPKVSPQPSAALKAAVPPPIPGEPADVLVAITAAAKTMHVPPAISASIVAAAKAGDKGAKKQLTEAAKIYAASVKGDKSALAQIQAVSKDSKQKYGPALQKAAALAAAVGLAKGRKLYADRSHAKKEKVAAAQRAAVVAEVPAAAPSAPNEYLHGLIRFGGAQGIFANYYRGTRPQNSPV